MLQNLTQSSATNHLPESEWSSVSIKHRLVSLLCEIFPFSYLKPVVKPKPSKVEEALLLKYERC